MLDTFSSLLCSLNAFTNKLLIYIFIGLIRDILSSFKCLFHYLLPGFHCPNLTYLVPAFVADRLPSNTCWSLTSWYVGPHVFVDSVIRALKIEGPQRPAVSAASRPGMKFQGGSTMSRSREQRHLIMDAVEMQADNICYQ